MSTETQTEAGGLADLAPWLRDWLLSPCEHYTTTHCSPCLRDRILSWLTARLTDDDVVEAAARQSFADHTDGWDLHEKDAEQDEPYLVDLWSGWARSALAAAAGVIGGER